MDSRSLRSLTALAAAYAIALQAVLAGMALGAQASHAASGLAILCLSEPAQNDHAPADWMPCCLGAVCCQIGGEPGALPEAHPFDPERTELAAFFAPHVEIIDALALDGPQQPRAPPAA